VSRACGVCGAPAPPPFRAPAPELAPDLDLRPGEPTRSTLPEWLQTCRSCGAVAPDLGALPPDAAAIVGSPCFTALQAETPAAAPFLRWAMLCDPADRAEAFLQAAWIADDAGADASELRRKCAAAWGEPHDPQSALRLIDVLRRAGSFAAAASRADALEKGALDEGALDENSSRILAFQRTRIAAGDATRHLISSALRPPARMPHVAHGKPPTRGFWSTLLGSRA
jgi:hypothetical protein